MQIKMEIETCEQCPKHSSAYVYTGDSWDNVREIKCKETGKIVHGYLDWYDKSFVPKDCPLRVVE